MGYSGRYHAASLAAVFVALAIGILIGIGLAEDVVSSASEEVESSLREDLDQSQGQVDDLEGELAEQDQFTEQAAPALVAGRLARDRVALVSLGDLPDDDTATDVQNAVEAAGGEFAAVAVLDLPPDLASLAQAAGPRFSGRSQTASPELLGTAIGRELTGGGPVIERVQEQLFSRFSGDLDGVNRIVFVAQPPDALQADLGGQGRAFGAGLLRGAAESAEGTVGVERTEADPTTLEVFSTVGISTVDDVEQAAGQVSLVFVLLGAEGDFGVKEGATSLLPDLLPERPLP